MTMADGSTLVGVSATTRWTLPNCATKTKRADSTLDDPWAVRLFGDLTS